MLLLMHKKNALFIALLPFKRFCNGIIRLQFKFAFLLYQAGYELALKFQPDLIVCDIMMPVPDGYGFLHLINKNENLKSIPFIFLTAKTERNDFRRGMEMGADDYITKPFTDIELLNAIESRLQKAKEQIGRAHAANKLHDFFDE